MIYLIIFFVIITRFIPHLPNFAPITALAIFSAANLGWKKSVGLTLAVRFISDIFLGFFSWPLMVAVYSCHLAGVLFGMWIRNNPSRPPLLKKGSGTADASQNRGAPLFSKEGAGGVNFHRWTKIIGASLLSSAIFFLVTNFAFLYSTYPHTIAGIVSAYTNGLPFFRGTVLGDLGYTAALFGAYQFALYAKSIKRFKRATA